MIKTFIISQPKDINGMYILPDDVLYRDEVLDNLKYHQDMMKNVQNLMSAIICAMNQDKQIVTEVNGWHWNYVRINNNKLFYKDFFLDKNDNILYQTEYENELVMIQRNLKLKKLNK